MRPDYQEYSGPSVPQLTRTQSDQLDMSFADFHDMLHGKTRPSTAQTCSANANTA